MTKFNQKDRIEGFTADGTMKACFMGYSMIEENIQIPEMVAEYPKIIRWDRVTNNGRGKRNTIWKSLTLL